MFMGNSTGLEPLSPSDFHLTCNVLHLISLSSILLYLPWSNNSSFIEKGSYYLSIYKLHVTSNTVLLRVKFVKNPGYSNFPQVGHFDLE